jgi:acetoin utilization protein AcuB
MLVQAIMTVELVTTDPSRSVESALRLMHEGRFRHLPVVQNGRLVGIISDRDVNSTALRTVGEVMHGDVITVTPDTPIDVAARLMLDNKLGALPVVHSAQGDLAGIVTQSDLFAVLARLLGGEGPSTRLELRLNNLAVQLAQVARLAVEHHVSISSIVTLPRTDTDGRYRRIVLRIGTLAAAPFTSALRDAGIDVVA